MAKLFGNRKSNNNNNNKRKLGEGTIIFSRDLTFGFRALFDVSNAFENEDFVRKLEPVVGDMYHKLMDEIKDLTEDELSEFLEELDERNETCSPDEKCKLSFDKNGKCVGYTLWNKFSCVQVCSREYFEQEVV